MLICETLPRTDPLQRSSFRTASQLLTVISRIGPENAGISRWEEQVAICPPLKNREPEYTIADGCPQRRIKEEGNQVELEKQRHNTLSPVAMSPTYPRSESTFNLDDYGRKGSITPC